MFAKIFLEEHLEPKNFFNIFGGSNKIITAFNDRKLKSQIAELIFNFFSSKLS